MPTKAGRAGFYGPQRAIIVAMMPELEHIAITVSDNVYDALPRFSGVYRFYGEDNALLYIGKSVDIRARVQAHYQEGRTPGRHQRMMQQVQRIDCTATAGEIGALLIENAAIKAEVPLYNRRQRRLRKLWTLHLQQGQDGFLKPVAADFTPESERRVDSYGLYSNKKHVDSSLQRHARDHGLCLRMLGVDKGRGPCFQYQLQRCDGACAGQESPEDHNARLLSALDRDRIAAWPFTGPLALAETNIRPWEDQPAAQYHVIDHWSYVDSVNSISDAASLIEIQGTRFFDRDAYRLLLSALRQGKVTVMDARSGETVDNPLLGRGAN